MLKQCNAMATIAVKDVEAARQFYEGQLGLDPVASEPGMLVLRSGDSTVMVYESAFAGTNKANAATWSVTGDIEELVRTLRARGVPFLHYDDMPDTKRQGDIHVSDDRKVAWCHDPDGNILCLAHG
jgi:catechol 2,3-dioxygenase-like lactoylglutathione lyase family enzyme